MTNTKIPSELIADNSVGITQLNVSDGTNGQVLTTNGSGTLSFSTISGYTDSDVETYLNTSEIYTDPTNNYLGVGSGASTPSHVFHVQKSVANGTLVKLQNASNTASDVLLLNTAGTGSGTNILDVQASGSSKFLVRGDGNVGIGTDSPASSVHVLGDVQAQDSRGGSLASVILHGGSSSTYPSIEVDQSNPMTFVTGSTERIRITGTGNVGIGTDNPSGKLHIDSGLAHNACYITTGSTGGTGYDASLTIAGGANNSEMELRMGIVGNETRDRIKTYQGNMYFRTNDTEYMSLTSSGSLDFNKTMSASDHDFIVMGYNGSWGSYTGKLASVSVNDGTGVVGRYGITYRTGSGDTGGAFVISDLYYGGYGASGEVFEVNQSRMKIPQIINFDNRVDTSYIQGDASSGNLQYFSDQAQIFHTYVGGWQQRMIINDNGSIGAPSGTNIYNPSDIRLKENITPLTEGLNIINNLNPIKFNWKEGFDESEADKTLLGFVAQEVQEVLPEAVDGFGTGNVEINDTIIENPLRVNEKFIIPVLVKAIQEQQTIIDDLKARIETLENN